MEIFQLNSFIKSVRHYIKSKQPFAIERKENSIGVVQLKKFEFERDLLTADIFCEYLLEKTKILDFKMLEIAQISQLHTLINLCSDLIESYFRRYKKSKRSFNFLRNKLIALRLGGRVDPLFFDDSKSEILTFISVNQLDIKFQALKIQLPYDEVNGIAFPFELETGVISYLYWKDLRRQEFVDKRGKIKGFRFYYKEKFAFQTDENLKFISQFTILDRAIIQYDRVKSRAIRYVEKINGMENCGKNYLEIWIQNTQVETMVVILRTGDGRVYAIGTESGYLATPPDLYYKIHTNSDISTYKLEITSKEFEQIFSRFAKIKFNSAPIKFHCLLDVIDEVIHWGIEVHATFFGKSFLLAGTFFPNFRSQLEDLVTNNIRLGEKGKSWERNQC